jgi:hypothetical protein
MNAAVVAMAHGDGSADMGDRVNSLISLKYPLDDSVRFRAFWRGCLLKRDFGIFGSGRGVVLICFKIQKFWEAI